MQNLLAGFLVSVFIHFGIILSISNIFNIDMLLNESISLEPMPAYLVFETKNITTNKKTPPLSRKIIIPDREVQNIKEITSSVSEELFKITKKSNNEIQKTPLVVEKGSQKEIVYFSSLIKNQIKNAWKRPLLVNDLIVEIELTLLPTGEIQNTIITKGSGNKAFDSSALTAIAKVQKFENLVMAPKLFDENFRIFTLVFNPFN
jgi:TonB family protein